MFLLKTEDSMHFDHHGKEIKFPFKINSKTVENYPKRILRNNEQNVKTTRNYKNDAAYKNSIQLKKRPLESDVRDLNDEFTIKEISEIYVPIFEARLVGPKKKIGIMRIDAVRKKILKLFYDSSKSLIIFKSFKNFFFFCPFTYGFRTF